MAPVEYLSNAYDARMSPRARAIALAASFAFVVLLLWALLRVGAFPGVTGRADQSPLMVFTPSTERRTAAAAPRAVTRTQPQTKQQETKRTPPTPPQTPTPPPELTIDLPGFIHLTRQDYAKSDIGKMPKRPAEAAAATAASNSAVAGLASGDTSSIAGAAPGGEPLYPGDWYRKPRPAETEPYMSADAEGWGRILCRTAERYHVEDCHEYGETPGSGIARGLRQAAWQFLIRPPKKGGKPLIGVWVSITYTIERRAARES